MGVQSEAPPGCVMAPKAARRDRRSDPRIFILPKILPPEAADDSQPRRDHPMKRAAMPPAM